MTTDNKTMAVDVLTAMSVAERVLGWEGYEQVIYELESSRAAVAELIEAVTWAAGRSDMQTICTWQCTRPLACTQDR